MSNCYKLAKRERAKVKSDLFAAYYDCRRNKRNTANALRFEVGLEEELNSLVQEILSGTYTIGRSCAFIVFKPVQREIFAADFRDRVVHHYVINKLEPIFERLFIDDSYSCRKGKGTHFGVERVDHFIRSCSDNYQQDCWILKIDIQGFFMNIRKEILYTKIMAVVDKHYHAFDKLLLSDLIYKVVMHNPVPGCVIKGSRNDWQGLPQSKSLFRTGGTVGLPIGNLTSQVFANLYLNDFDNYVKRTLKVKYYGRYVDDMVLVHTDKHELQNILTKISAYLSPNLGLTVHPHKIYLQHYSKGVRFVGVTLKPYRRCIGKRIAKSMNKALINDYQAVFDANDAKYRTNISHWLSSVNSYLGISRHYKSYRLRKKLCDKLVVNPIGICFENEYRLVRINEV